MEMPKETMHKTSKICDVKYQFFEYRPYEYRCERYGGILRNMK